MVQTISYNPTPGQQFTPDASNTITVPSANNNGTIINPNGAPLVDNSGVHSDVQTQTAAIQSQIATIQAQIDAATKAGLKPTDQIPGTAGAPTDTTPPADQSNWDKILSMFNAGKAQEAALPAVPTVEDQTNKILATFGYTPDSFKQVADLNTQLTSINDQINSMETAKSQALAMVTRNPDMPVELQSQEQKRITQDYAIQEAGLGGKATILQAQIATMTGDYEKATTMAQNYVQLATTAQSQQVQDIEYTMDFYKDVYSAMDTSDKNAAQQALDNARNAKLDAENTAQQTFDNSIKSAQLKIDQANAGMGGGTGGSYEDIAQQVINAGGTPQDAVNEAILVAQNRGTTLSKNDQDNIFNSASKMTKTTSPVATTTTPTTKTSAPATPVYGTGNFAKTSLDDRIAELKRILGANATSGYLIQQLQQEGYPKNAIVSKVGNIVDKAQNAGSNLLNTFSSLFK